MTGCFGGTGHVPCPTVYGHCRCGAGLIYHTTYQQGRVGQNTVKPGGWHCLTMWCDRGQSLPHGQSLPGYMNLGYIRHHRSVKPRVIIITRGIRGVKIRSFDLQNSENVLLVLAAWLNDMDAADHEGLRARFLGQIEALKRRWADEIEA